MAIEEGIHIGSLARLLPMEVAEKVVEFLSEWRGEYFALTLCPIGDYYMELWENAVPDDVIGRYGLGEGESRYTLSKLISADITHHVLSNGGRPKYMERRTAARKAVQKRVDPAGGKRAAA